MLTEIEQGMIRDLVGSYGLPAVVRMLAAECARRAQGTLDPGSVWLHDATYLLEVADRQLWARGGGMS